MAMNDLHTDTTQSDNNGGTTEGAATVSGTAGSTNSTATVTLDGGSDLSGVVVGDGIRISGETGGKNGTDVFEITVVNDGADTVDVTPTPGTAGALTWAIGGAWATGQRALDVVEDGGKIHMKDTASYTETLNINVFATRTTPIEVIGYTTTKGDGGSVTVDGQSSRASGILHGSISSGVQAHYVFKNFRITGHTSHGIDLTTNNNDCVTYKNVRADNNGGRGINTDDFFIMEFCQADNNTNEGLYSDFSGTVFSCTSFANGGHGIRSQGCILLCLCYDNGGDQINTPDHGVVAFCTVDGNKASNPGTIGINFSAGGTLNVAVAINNIMFDCTTGLRAGTATDGENRTNRNNLYFSNGTDVALDRFPATTDGIFADPKFTDDASGDYSLQSDSPAIGKGVDLAGSQLGTDIGAIQTVPAASAGISFVHPGMAGGINA